VQPSAFTSVGLLDLNSNEPLAKRLYGVIKAALGSAFAPDTPSLTDNFAYAFAMATARSATLLERAYGQMLPTEVYDLLAPREDEYGLIPAPNATITERRAALAARMLLPGGAGRLNVENTLEALLGATFVAYRTTKPTERAVWPPMLGAVSQNFALPTVARKLVQVVPAISIQLGSAQTVAYQPVVPVPDPTDPNALPVLTVGDALIVEPELPMRAERVVVTGLGTQAGPGGTVVPTFTATFLNAHESECWASTMPFPLWTSTQRASLVLLTSAAALDMETRRQTHELMDQLARGVSTWALVQQTGPSQAGPFLLTKSPLNATPLGVVTVP
jgi:hypothetical protein